jgi:hypothetical protein
MKELAFGRVREVTETEENVLMPLSPLDSRNTHFFATIIYDLVKMGYSKKDFEHYFKDFLKKNSLRNILDYVKNNGRMIWENTDILNKKEIVIKCPA